MKTLLIPVDFSKTSDRAVDFGLQLAEKCGYHVMLHHSVDFSLSYESMYMDAPHIQSFTQKVVDRVEVSLENLHTKCKKSGISISRHLTMGSLIADMKELIAEHDVKLVVMGTKGASGLKEFLIGSNTEKVVRLIDCPVISVPSKTSLKDVRKILVPVDLSEIRPSFLREVSKLQQFFSASIEFCWVKTPHAIDNEELIKEEFERLLGQYEIASSSFEIVRNTFPQDGLLHRIEESGADLLAMATHARRGLSHWFSGSLTEDVVNHSKVPIWSSKLTGTEEPIILEKFQDIKAII